MRTIANMYASSEWYAVFNFREENAKTRFYLLLQTIVQAVVNGFTGGIFYTGYLVGHGINIVDISVLSVITNGTSLFMLFIPYILERFPKRRTILSVTRLLFHVLQILGISLLPLVVHSMQGRVNGLIILVFLAYLIGNFNAGYSPWHMPYITDDVRMRYFTASTLLSTMLSTVMLLVTSLITDRLAEQDQLSLISVLRYVAFGLALWDVYLLQKPKEPVYLTTSQKPKILDIFRLPLSNKPFLLTMVVAFFFRYIYFMTNSVLNTWLLQTVDAGYLYINVINCLYFVAILVTSKFSRHIMRKKGTFTAFVIALIPYVPTYIAFAFVNHQNYLWLMTLVRIVDYIFGMLLTLCVNNFIYLCLPEADQTNYTTFNTVVANTAVFLGSATATFVVSAMGNRTVSVFGYALGSVPVLLMTTGILLGVLAGVIFLLRKKLPQETLRP